MSIPLQVFFPQVFYDHIRGIRVYCMTIAETEGTRQSMLKIAIQYVNV
jgi:hypothetical protein